MKMKRSQIELNHLYTLIDKCFFDVLNTSGEIVAIMTAASLNLRMIPRQMVMFENQVLEELFKNSFNLLQAGNVNVQDLFKNLYLGRENTPMIGEVMMAVDSSIDEIITASINPTKVNVINVSITAPYNLEVDVKYF